MSDLFEAGLTPDQIAAAKGISVDAVIAALQAEYEPGTLGASWLEEYEGAA